MEKTQDVKSYVGWFTAVHNLLFCVHAMRELRNEGFLLVCSSVRSKQLLCFVHSQGQKYEQKHIKELSQTSKPSPCISLELNSGIK